MDENYLSELYEWIKSQDNTYESRYSFDDFKSQLKATTMVSPDIRAGISLLIAALSAKGTSIIHNIEQIDRGYERIDERLRAIGAKIIRIA